MGLGVEETLEAVVKQIPPPKNTVKVNSLIDSITKPPPKNTIKVKQSLIIYNHRYSLLGTQVEITNITARADL
jgi:hypothetical protein